MALTAALVGLVGLASPAGAHGTTGTMGIEVVPGAAPLTADVRVLLEYANDREVVPGTAGTLDGDLGPDAHARTASSDSSDGPSPARLAVIAVVLVAGAGLAFRLVRRR